MMVYLDTVIVIYAVEGTALFQPRAQTRIASLRAAGDQLAVSDLTRLECRVQPLRLGDAMRLANFETFLTAPDVVKVPLPSSVYERATLIRAQFNYKLGDALHLAAAVEAGCGGFLTNDLRLSAFPDILVEVLP
jgi:predicted nucleic acid-binding protein